MTQPPTLTVIVPTLNELDRLPLALARISTVLPGAEIIVVDGGSTDGTADVRLPAAAKMLSSPPGRGRQLAAGAAEARGNWLLFLHADTLLPANAAAVLDQAFAHAGTRIGTFRLTFDSGSRFLRVCAWFTRFDTVFTRFGDQGIVVRADLYRELGGFPPWPLFEDVEFLRRARRLSPVVSFPAGVTTSSRRFQRNGAFRQQWQNARLLIRFLLGASPQHLAAEYRTEPAREPTQSP